MVQLETWNAKISIFQKFGKNDKIKGNISNHDWKEIPKVSANKMKYILGFFLVFIINWSKRRIVQIQSSKQSLSKVSSEAAVRRCSSKQVLLNISQQQNTCVGVSF